MSTDKKKQEISVMEAVDILSNMSEIDLKVPHQGEVGESEEINWRDPREALLNQETLKEAFRILHRYLQNMVRNDRASLSDAETQKGVQAIMLLVDEAMNKMDRYAALYPDQGKPISKLKEVEDLKKYYLQQILGQMPRGVEKAEEWEEELKGKGLIAGEQKRGIKDLEGVRRDHNYELFFIKSAAGRPYFNPALFRHIRLLGNFDELVSQVEEERSFSNVEELYDWEMYEGARELLVQVAPYLDAFYKEAMKHKKRPFVAALNQAVMALQMAANPKNLKENDTFKSCLEYFSDFHLFLRRALESPGYGELIGERQSDLFSRVLLHLTHAFCCYFFLRVEPRRETLKLINQMIEQGEGGEKELADVEELQIWADLRNDDEKMRDHLTEYPNGPILKTLEMFREGEEFEGFDPLLHKNFPSQLYNFKGGGFHVTVIRLPCPTKQLEIQKATVVKEFSGFLHFYQRETKPDRHLLINLQDRTSWEEEARCKAIESYASRAEFNESLFVVGLPKETDFYFQSGEFEEMGGAPVFLEKFLEQIEAGPKAGYYFPPSLKGKEVVAFAEPAFTVIHNFFFEGKETLSQEERQNFIEIFYQVLILKLIESTLADSVSFSCKDGIDTGAVQGGIFYAFLQLLSGKKWGKEERDQLYWLLYSPALIVRERAVQKRRIDRAVRALEAIHRPLIKGAKKEMEAINQLYSELKFPFNLD